MKYHGDDGCYSILIEHIRKAFRITIKSLGRRHLGLLVYNSAKMSRQRQNGLSYVPKKILNWMLVEARGGLKATEGNRVTIILITLST